MFLKQQISILERFLKDHATLKTQVIAENSAFPSEEWITSYVYKNIKVIFNNITVFTVFWIN